MMEAGLVELFESSWRDKRWRNGESEKKDEIG